MLETKITPSSVAQSKRRTIRSLLCRAIAAVVLGLVGLLALGATTVQAQVQIDQVESVTSKINGVTQSQLVVGLPEGECKPKEASCEGVSRSEVLSLIPGGTPPLRNSGSGNSSVIVQRGSNNDALVEQVGSGNESSITQMNGSGNEAVVRQTGRPAGGGTLSGRNNLAVVVQNGFMNEAIIRQWGNNNIAGIRLDGNNNGVTLRQEGNGNEYLLDFSGSGLGASTSTRSHQVVQLGTNNQLVQVGEGSMPFNVRQRGNRMRMVIRHH